MDRIAAARGAIVCLQFDLVELRRCCTLRRRLARRIIDILIGVDASKSSINSQCRSSIKK